MTTENVARYGQIPIAAGDLPTVHPLETAADFNQAMDLEVAISRLRLDGQLLVKVIENNIFHLLSPECKELAHRYANLGAGIRHFYSPLFRPKVPEISFIQRYVEIQLEAMQFTAEYHKTY